MSAPSAARLTEAALVLAAALALVAGFADGIAYLRWHLFAANMTGNTVLLGLALIRGDSATILGALAPIASLVLGAAVASAVRDRFGRGIPLLLEALMLAIASLVLRSVQLEIIAFAMGIQNQAIRTFAGITVNTSFITGDYAQAGTALVDVLSAPRRARGQRTLAIVSALATAYALGAAAAALLNAKMPHALLLPVPIVLAIAYGVRRGDAGEAQPPSQA
jgi:uncharacterized membrane protein YoaK (UPF0700 family)